MLPYDAFTTKDAKADRDESLAAGRIPIKTKDYEKLYAAALRLKENAKNQGFEIGLPGSRSELAIEFTAAVGKDEVLCRCRFDQVRADHILYDVKKVRSAHPADLDRLIVECGYDIQNHAYTLAYEQLVEDAVGRSDFVFLFCEIEEPYEVVPARLDGALREIGKRRWEKAVYLWRKLMIEGTYPWPGFADGAVTLSAPAWVLSNQTRGGGMEVMEPLSDKEKRIVAMTRLNAMEPGKEIRRTWRIRRLEVTYSRRSKENLWGRFGGGWNWKLGVSIGRTTVIVDLLDRVRAFRLIEEKGGMMDFTVFKQAVAAQWERMQSSGAVFRTATHGDDLWTTYLDAFPPGTNEIYRERREFDCSCCRHFVKNLGNAVAWVNGELVTLWDIQVSEPAFQRVADSMASAARRDIARPFMHFERTAGTDKNFEQIMAPKPEVKTWQHFFVNVRPELVAKRGDIPSILSEKISAHESFVKALNEISFDAINTVIDLISQGSLYRGDEHRSAVERFGAFKRKYEGMAPEVREIYAWTESMSAGAVARIRATVIGTLLLDLSEGKDIEAAVASFEAKVAPHNYKRPTALITKAMIDKAKVEIEGLGLTSALDRRLATVDDVPVGEMLFVDRTRAPIAGGGVLDDLSATAPVKVKTFDKVEEVTFDKFVQEIVPRAESLEVLFENRQAGNLVSLVTSTDPTAAQLFKWPNPFSWSYRGELADSIKERVKRAGGNVVGDLCCRLSWFNYDDLDFHLKEPSGHVIFFRDRESYVTGGQLDVDMNAGTGRTREPVENIFYPTRGQMTQGVYTLLVHQFCARESDNVGFEAEIDYLGDVRKFSYPKALRQNEVVPVAQFRYSHKTGIEMLQSLPESDASRTEWGLKTGAFHKVRALMQSPNCWTGLVLGNRHAFFMLDGCTNDGTARGFFNEFLRSELDRHRKVLEVVGAKVRAAAGPADQLSGLGFSSTKRDQVIVRVKGSFSRVVKVTF